MIRSIIRKLKVFDINNIVSIDNEWIEENGESNNSYIDEFEKNDTNVLTYIDKQRIKLEEKERIIIRNENIEEMSELFNNNFSELQDLKDRIIKRIGKKNKLEPTLAALDNILKDIKSEYEDINIYRINTSKEPIEGYDGNTLFILDKNMGIGYEDVIVDKILDIKEAKKNSKDLILIYSSECEDYYDTHQSKIRYLESKNVESDEEKLAIIYQLWAIRKIGDVEKLASNINNMLSKSIYGTSLSYAIDFKRSAERKAYNDLLMIDIEDLQGTFKDSFIEGDNIISSFDRIMKALINKNYKDSDNWPNELIESYKYLIEYERQKIEEVKKIFMEEEDIPEAYKKFKKEHVKLKLEASIENNAIHNIADYSINKIFMDITTGDLFRYKDPGQEKWRLCMLISQECNNVIRMPIDNVVDTPNRKNEDAKLLIFDYEEIPKGSITNSKLNKLNKSIATRIWPVKIDERYYSLSPTDRIISINTNILDLCTLSKEGKAVRNSSIDCALDFKGYQARKYFKRFYENEFWNLFNKKREEVKQKYIGLFKTYLDECSVALDCEGHCTGDVSFENYFKNIESQAFEDCISLLYGIEYESDRFMIERICRIEPKRTLLSIQDFVYNLSRTGADSGIAVFNE